MADRLWFFASARRWGTTTGVANLYRRRQHRRDFRLHAGPIAADRAARRSNKGGGGRVDHSRRRARTSSRSRTTGSGTSRIADRPARDRHDQERSERRLLPAARRDPGHVDAVRSRTSCCSTAGVTVSRFNFGGFGKDLFLERLRAVRRRHHRQRVDQRHRPRLHLQRQRQPDAEPVAPERTDASTCRCITGAHTIKAGVFWMYGLGGGHRDVHVPHAVRRSTACRSPTRSRTARPTQLTQYASPILTIDQLNPDLGLVHPGSVALEPRHGQRRPALRLGARIGAGHVGAGGAAGAGAQLPGGRERAELEGSEPAARRRVGSDRATGKTAIKVGINRYVHVQHDRASRSSFDPATRRSTARHGRGRDAQRQSPARLRSDAAPRQRRMRAMANQNFGTFVPTTNPDPDWITGWGKRHYNWQASVAHRSRAAAELHGQRRAISGPGTATSW